jgi:antitoxin (DNA-binding transcriptional repressor) of toxin-antitoxin stability system
METYIVGDLKTHFSEVMDSVHEREEIAIAYGKKKEVIARIVPDEKGKEQRRENLEH